jgi:hypothetical protein
MTMTAGRARGPTPSLIGGSNGRPKRVDVLRLSECCRCHRNLVKGDTCIAIPKLGGAYPTPKRYCDECYGLILKKTSEDIAEISNI